jgi:lipoyl(octanoyl) transferase
VWEQRLANAVPDTLLLVEHEPVYTRGRRSREGELTLGPDFYAVKGIEIFDTDRGGKVTYHGPGQVVGYPIVGVWDVGAHLRKMEDAIVGALGREGVHARSRRDEGPDYTGVWVGERKIASLGVHVSHGVSTHGMAVNVALDLEPFTWIVPCGLAGVTMTSLAVELERQGGSAPARGELAVRFKEGLAALFAAAHGMRAGWVARSALGLGALGRVA